MEDIATKGTIISRIIENYLETMGKQTLDFAGNFVIALLILIIGWKCINYVVSFAKKVFERSRMDATLEGFLLSAIKIALKILLIFWAITKVGFAASSVIAILGSAGIALGLSLQGSLSNIAGGVILLFMKPFKVGDYIVEGATGNEGTVDAIGIMYTKIKTKDNRVVLIPNGNLSSETIINVTDQTTRLEDIIVGIEYSESIKKVRKVLEGIIERENAVLREKETEIFVNEFKDSCIDMRIRFWVKSEDYWTCRWRMLENIKEEFDANGISIPFNQLDVNIVNK